MFVPANWGWPQWIYIVLVAIGLGVALANSGRYTKNSSFGDMVVALIVESILFAAGGFFDEMHWPQVTIIVLWIASLALKLADDEENTTESFMITLIADGIVVFLLAMGGFFG